MGRNHGLGSHDGHPNTTVGVRGAFPGSHPHRSIRLDGCARPFQGRLGHILFLVLLFFQNDMLYGFPWASFLRRLAKTRESVFLQKLDLKW